MTEVEVKSGICGFSTTVTASSSGGRKLVQVSVASDCEAVRNMADEIAALDRMDALAGFMSNPVHRAAARHLRHAACPVPCGVLKALEVEAGFCLAKDVSIAFVKE